MKRVIAITAIVVAAAAGYWALAQPAPAPLPAILPAGALLYLEAKDFGALVADWNGSAEKRTWLASANYQAFSRSSLFLKLGQAQTEFASAAGLPADYALLGSVAGGNSALAIYNIGDLEFLYVTRLASARALDTALWKSRGTYQTRSAGGVTYYLKEDAVSRRTAAFVYSGGMLLLATKGDLIAGALELMAQAQRPSIASESWFSDAVKAAAPGANQLRMVYNLERLIATPHFRSYWIQRNISDLREFRCGLADLEQSRDGFRERRVLLRATAGAAIADESAAGRALALVPDDAGLYRAWTKPAPEWVQWVIAEKIFANAAAAAAPSTSAPMVSNQGEEGSQEDLETRIDETPLADDRDALAFQVLRALLQNTPVDAMLEVSSTRTDAGQVFTGSRSAIALLSASVWDANAVRLALGSAAASIWSNRSAGAGWRAASNGIQEIDGLGRIALAIDGRWLIVATSPEAAAELFARRNRTPVDGAVYAAGWRHAGELPNFEHMVRLIDFPQIPPAAGPDQERQPMFFSENIASLGRALGRIQSGTVTVHDAGTMLRENVVYRIAP
jgi:hypothetical protein